MPRSRLLPPAVVLLCALIAASGCGRSSEVRRVTRTVDRPAPVAAPTVTQVKPVALPPAASKKPRPAYAQCDANIKAKAATTTCGFAQNAFYEYWDKAGADQIRVYSPATRQKYTTD